MKATRKLVPALAMLLVAAVVMSTASYAWFSMNREVTATDMQVNVNATNIYLLIGSGEDDTTTEIQADNTITTSLPVLAEDANLIPAAHETIANRAAANASTNWYTASAIAPTASTIKAETKKLLGTEAAPATLGFANMDTEGVEAYVIKKTVYLTLAAGSTDSGALTAAVTFAEPAGFPETEGATFDPVKVVLVSDTAYAEFAADDANTAAAAIALATSVTDAAVVQVDIYIYYDGNHEEVFTNNTANLGGAEIDIQFSVVD